MARILFLDIETSPMVATTWTLYPKYLSHDNIVSDWYILCAAWKWLGESKVYSAEIKSPGDDFVVCRELRNAIASADVICGHNSDRFDIKKLNTRMIIHRIKPIPKIPSLDTLKEVKKIAAFSSNRLDFLAKTLVGEGKLKTDFDLWKDVIAGDKVALAKMVKYCKVDVVRLQQVYEVLRPYMKTHVHVGVLDGKDKSSCPKCGSVNVKKNGIRVSPTGNRSQEMKCECGSYHRVPLKTIEI